MSLILYFSKSHLEDAHRFGCDLDEVFRLLEKVRDTGLQFRLKDTDKMPDDELSSAYVEAILPSILKKYRVRQVFGSRRHSGGLFGKQVPALVVYDDKNHRPVDVYPHEIGPRKIQIAEFLKETLKETKKA